MTKKTLLIIGNGFDLKCGLKSKYIDFWRYQRNNHDHFNRFVEYLEKNSYQDFDSSKLNGFDELIELEAGITFLDYYFTLFDWGLNNLSKNKVWSDIEDMLLFGFSSRNDYSSLTFDNCCICYGEVVNNRLNSYFNDAYENLILSKYLMKVFGKKQIDFNTYRCFILSEIDEFSLSFSKYIERQILEKSDYYELAQDLIMRITNAALNECEIVSFNYTEPVTGPNLANIHGLANKGKIVIGVTCGDGKQKEIAHNSWYYKATKEYKIANILANGIKVSAEYRDAIDVYVYGLSLGKQDYDFFENLFDEFDILMRLYSVKIHFCYSLYDGKTREEVAEETTDRVTRLINSFGDNHKTYGLLRSMIQKGHLFFDFIE